MGQIHDFAEEKLVIGVIFHDETVLLKALEVLKEKFGEWDMVSPDYSFSDGYSTYYDTELGGKGTRRIYSFEKTVRPDEQAEIKEFTNDLENSFLGEGGRLINLDPGLMSHGRFMLSTTKDASFRIPLKRGIYTEMTLFYARGAWQKLPWTYMDYQSETVISFLEKVRRKYLTQRKIAMGLAPTKRKRRYRKEQEKLDTGASIMEMKALLEKLGIEKYPGSFVKIYRELEDGDDLSLGNVEEIKALDEKYGLLCDYTEIVLRAAEALKKDKEKLTWAKMAVKYNETVSTDWDKQLEIPKFDGTELSDMLPLLVRLVEAPKTVKLYQSRGFSEEEIAKRVKTFGGAMNVCKLIYGRPCLDTVQYKWMTHTTHAMLFDYKAFNFQPDCWNSNATVLRSNVSGEVAVMMTEGRFHKSGLVLGSRGCEDETDSFDADFTETESQFIGHTVKRGKVQRELSALDKNEWQPIIKKGDGVLSVHIPRNTNLSPDYVAESLREALTLSRERYPDINPKYAVCFSWLMDPTLIDMLGEDAKISSFSERFKKFPLLSGGSEFISYVFPGFTMNDVESFPESTSLQRKIKELMINGGYIYGTAGIVTDEEII